MARSIEMVDLVRDLPRYVGLNFTAKDGIRTLTRDGDGSVATKMPLNLNTQV